MKTQSKRVVLAANTGWYLFNFRRNLIEHLSQEGFEVILIAPIDRYLRELASRGYHTHPIPLDSKSQNPFRELKTSFRLLQLLARLKPAVVLSFTVKPNIYLGISTQLLNLPLLSTVTGLGTAFIAGGLLQKLVVMLYRISQRRCGAIVFQNQDDEEMFKKLEIGSGRKKIIIPGSGVNVDRFPKSKYTHSTDKKILFIGRLLYDKGVSELVEAAKIIAPRYKEKGTVTFQFLGGLAPQNLTSVSPDDVEKWKKFPFIEFLDWADDIRPAINAAYCVVLPSYREGLPKSLIEAGSMGRPVITTNVPGCREVVVNGENGLLCRARSVDDLVSKIEQMLDFGVLDWEKMAESGRRRVEIMFDERVIIKKYLELLAEIQR